MFRLHQTSLQPFVERLASRSILTEEEAVALLALKGQMTQVPAHSDFVRQGEYVDHACLVVDGLVGRFGQNKDGGRQITCIHIPGDMADLPSVVSPKSAWGLSALCTTTILRIPHVELRHIAAEHVGLAEAFWRDCVADGSIFSEWVVNVGRRDALTRVAHVLCEISVRRVRAKQGEKTLFAFELTQSDLADATGLTGVHVNRTLKELRTRSLATVRSNVVTIYAGKLS
ncbi:MAG: Crp/Fnr family transcriptional regulator [Alphaproteobacteria bacterium]|nr:MAG: Crp/Fnr family transcriptional regulator [Alphaproteobacteria bacterium]